MQRIIVLTRQPEGYAARRFMEAAANAQARLDLIDPHEFYLYLVDSNPVVALEKAEIEPGKCAVIPRLGSTATEYSLAALDVLERAGMHALNSYASLMRLRHKFSALCGLAAAGLSVPDSTMLRAPNDVAPAVERLGGYPVVLKFIRGSQGVGVIYAPDESVVRSVLEAMNLIHYDVLIQRYYPAGAERDVRVLVLGGEPRWAVRRVSRHGRFRSNFHRGGTVEAMELDATLRGLAVRATKAFGLGLAGVDIIEGDNGPLVLEVNASPGIQTIEQAYGVDAAGAIVEHVKKS